MFGTVTISAHNLTPGRKVRLTVTVQDFPGNRQMRGIVDTYELPVITAGSVTFGKIIMGSISLFPMKSDPTTYVNDVLAKRAPTGSLVTIEASVDGGPAVKRDCLWKPTKNGSGQGPLICQH
jgi:hypothetical protein